VFSFFILISILVGSLKGIDVIFRDFFELYKIIIFAGVYTVTLLSIKSNEDRMRIIKFMIFCILISVLIAVQQYYNLFGLNEKYVRWLAPTQYATLVDNYPHPRAIGMTSNPNEYAVMSGIGCFLSWSLLVQTKQKRYLIYMLVCCLGLLFTSSRSGMAFLLVCLLLCNFLYLFDLLRSRRLKAFNHAVIINVLFALFVTVLFLFLPQTLTWRIKAGLSMGTDNSFQARLSNWNEHISYFKISPIFGLGPAKSIVYESAVDNEWLLLLRRYGIIGTLYFIYIYFIPIMNRNRSYFKTIYISVICASAIYMIPAAIFHSFRLMPLVMILAAMVPSDNCDDTMLVNCFDA
jgi:O-antigen ligase